MGKLTVFLCTGKDCTRAWRRVCSGSPGKWLRHQARDAGLPFKLNVVETACMDQCEQAANLCCVRGDCAGTVAAVRSADDADRVLAMLRSCLERSRAQEMTERR